MRFGGIVGRLPQVADQVLAEFAQDTNQGCCSTAVEMWEPGEWHHGWQHNAFSCSECHCHETVVLAQSCVADQAHLCSHSGPSCNRSFSACWLLIGYDFPLQVEEVACVCGTRLDSRGKHRAACPRSGLLRIKKQPPPPRGHSLGSVVKLVQQCVATRRFETFSRRERLRWPPVVCLSITEHSQPSTSHCVVQPLL